MVLSFISALARLHLAKPRTSLVVQMVENLPVMWETWVLSLSWEHPLEEGMATHSRGHGNPLLPG